ncbi:MAG: two-component system response regulator [Crocinitomicaceae bacterium]|nr:two-component system response regulator [Crocinitomicaceae bacterium]|tara:strand:+ start:1972 stop:2436 length:465 start_codon:yes stop_codon:yes gene_type:complete
MPASKISILYIDDEENNLTSFKATFRRDYKIHTAISADEGRKILEDNPVDIIITDQRMPDETGVEFLSSILEKYPEPIRILLTGYTDIEAVIDAINKGQVYRYITKPWNEQELRMNIENAYEVYRLRKENKELLEKLKKANQQLEFLLRQKLLD